MQLPTSTMSRIIPLVMSLTLIVTQSAQAFNITQILDKHPEFSTFNHYLTVTHLASEINRRDTITVLAVDNSAMSSLLSKSLPLYTLRNVLSLHILVDYFGSKKLHQLTDGSVLTASVFQSTGSAPGTSGYVNITDLSGGKVGFRTEDDTDKSITSSQYVKSIAEIPYSISVIQISSIINSESAEAPTPEPSQTNLATLLAKKGCKSFSALLTATGADKTYQSDIDGGLTVFCPGDAAVDGFLSKYKDNLTDAGKLAVALYHGVPVYNNLGMLKSSNGLTNTLATNGVNRYDITVQNAGEDVTLRTKIVTATVAATLVDQDPLAVFKIDKVLLPRELFKKPVAEAPEPSESPAPAPEKKGAAEEPVAAEPDTADGVASDKVKNGGGKMVINGGGLILGVMMSVGVFL
ncbi:Fasciclin-like arabinogalactan protein 2-like protein [Drosera capensis]